MCVECLGIQVITATVQIVLEIIRHGFLKISDLSVILFDECHIAHKNDPMDMLMAKLKEFPEKDQPHVIELTESASPAPQHVVNDSKNLEKTFHATITAAKRTAFTNILLHSTCPNESVLPYDTNTLTEFDDIIAQKIESLFKLIDDWPSSETYSENTDNNQLSNVQKKFKKICKNASVQSLGRFCNVKYG